MRISDWSSDVCSSDLPTLWQTAGPRSVQRSTAWLFLMATAFSKTRGLQNLAQPQATQGAWTRACAPASAQPCQAGAQRSEERRVGKECGSTGSYWCAPSHEKKKTKQYKKQSNK